MPDAPWEVVLDDALARQEPRTTRRSVGVNYPPALFAIVLEAARLRGMSMAAYQRRAALAFACLDTGEDWDIVMAEEPPFGTFVTPNKSAAHAGQKFGYWKITSLRG